MAEENGMSAPAGKTSHGARAHLWRLHREVYLVEIALQRRSVGVRHGERKSGEYGVGWSICVCWVGEGRVRRRTDALQGCRGFGGENASIGQEEQLVISDCDLFGPDRFVHALRGGWETKDTPHHDPGSELYCRADKKPCARSLHECALVSMAHGHLAHDARWWAAAKDSWGAVLDHGRPSDQTEMEEMDGRGKARIVEYVTYVEILAQPTFVPSSR
nr:hypothetical protein CFP56_32381 [Quercus suber]